MPESTITSKGQITVPGKIRKALGLEPGTKVSFWMREDGVVEMQPEMIDLLSLQGSLKPNIKGVSIEDMEEAIAQEATSK